MRERSLLSRCPSYLPAFLLITAGMQAVGFAVPIVGYVARFCRSSAICGRISVKMMLFVTI
jgi:hypothetical protein